MLKRVEERMQTIKDRTKERMSKLGQSKLPKEHSPISNPMSMKPHSKLPKPIYVQLDYNSNVYKGHEYFVKDRNGYRSVFLLNTVNEYQQQGHKIVLHTMSDGTKYYANQLYELVTNGGKNKPKSRRQKHGSRKSRRTHRH